MKKIFKAALKSSILVRGFMVLACVFLVLTGISLYSTFRTTEKEVMNDMDSQMQKASDYLFYRLDKIMTQTDIIRNNLEPYLESEVDIGSQIEEYAKIQQLLVTVLNEKEISYCRIYTVKQKLYSNQISSTWSIKRIDDQYSNGEFSTVIPGWEATHLQHYASLYSDSRVISYICPVHSTSQYKLITGIIIADVTISELEGILYVSKGENLCVIDAAGNIVLSTSEDQIGKKIGPFSDYTGNAASDVPLNEYFSYEDKIYKISEMDDTGWYLAASIDKSQIFKINFNIVISILLFFLVMTDIVFCLILVIYNMRLENNMTQVSLKAARCQMQAMQAQIKPHFMYNTIDVIKWMVMDQRSEDSVWMLNELSRFLHLSFGKNNDIVPLAEEIEHVRAYVFLMEKRFDKKFRVALEIEEETMLFRLPKFTLQPLVENAILHGILPSDKDNCTVTIRSWEEDKIWHIEIEDNGAGMPQEIASRLLNLNTDQYAENSYGAYNVQARLMIFSENTSHMYVNTIEGKGTCVSIELPVIYAQKEAVNE